MTTKLQAAPAGDAPKGDVARPPEFLGGHENLTSIDACIIISSTSNSVNRLHSMVVLKKLVMCVVN